MVDAAARLRNRTAPSGLAVLGNGRPERCGRPPQDPFDPLDAIDWGVPDLRDE